MGNIFVTSDLHFGHTNLQEGIRGFNSDELIIENWNKVVRKKHDRIYVLGDFCMEKPRIIREVIPKLQGEIIMIGGNHDDLSCAREFLRQGIPTLGVLKLYNLWFTHVPIRTTEFLGIKGNVHGHIHKGGYIICPDGTKIPYNPEIVNDPRYYNVNVEFHDYQLVPLEAICDYYQSQNLKE